MDITDLMLVVYVCVCRVRQPDPLPSSWHVHRLLYDQQANDRANPCHAVWGDNSLTEDAAVSGRLSRMSETPVSGIWVL